MNRLREENRCQDWQPALVNLWNEHSSKYTTNFYEALKGKILVQTGQNQLANNLNHHKPTNLIRVISPRNHRVESFPSPTARRLT
jgi:hypothetical protein